MSITLVDKKDKNTGKYTFPIYYGTVLANPFTEKKVRGIRSEYIVRDRDSALRSYSRYLDLMYMSVSKFQEVLDAIYILHVKGEDVYLQDDLDGQPSHGEVIIKKINARIVRDAYKKYEEEQSSR